MTICNDNKYCKHALAFIFQYFKSTSKVSGSVHSIVTKHRKLQAESVIVFISPLEAVIPKQQLHNHTVGAD